MFLFIYYKLEDETEDNSWQISQEEKDSVLYDVYDKQPEMILEEDEDGVELSDKWIIFDDEEYDDTADDRLVVMKA